MYLPSSLATGRRLILKTQLEDLDEKGSPSIETPLLVVEPLCASAETFRGSIEIT